MKRKFLEYIQQNYTINNDDDFINYLLYNENTIVNFDFFKSNLKETHSSYFKLYKQYVNDWKILNVALKRFKVENTTSQSQN